MSPHHGHQSLDLETPLATGMTSVESHEEGRGTSCRVLPASMTFQFGGLHSSGASMTSFPEGTSVESFVGAFASFSLHPL